MGYGDWSGMYLGQGLQAPGLAQMMNWNMPMPAAAPNLSALTAPAVSAAVPGVPGMTADQARLAQFQKQFQPNPAFGYASAGLQGLNTLGSLWLGFKGLGQAQEAFDFEKEMTSKNYLNSVKSYNTALEDRYRTRYANDPAKAESEIARQQLPSNPPGGK